MKITAREWSILFPATAPDANIAPAVFARALDLADSTRALPSDRIRILKDALPARGGVGWLQVQSAPEIKSKIDQRVLRFLDGMDVVRVTTENGSNFGHQHAALSVIRELRELGYRGPIEMIIPEGAEQKMVQLTTGLSDISFVLEKHFTPDRSKRAVGIVAACDHDERSFIDALGVEACVVLQPYDWPGVRRVETRKKAREELELPDSSRYVYSVDDPLLGVEPLLPAQMEAITAFVEKAMADQPPELAAKAPGVLALFRAVLSGRSDLMPVYGTHGRDLNESLVLQNLESGVRAFQRSEKSAGKDSKSAILLHIGPTDSDRLRDPSLSTKLRSLKKDDVEVIHAGTLPRPIFELLYKYATLPSVLEGANTSNLVQLLGKPFMSVFSAVTGLPKVPGGEEVNTVSEGLRKDEVEQQIARLSRLLHMFVTLGQQVPPQLFAGLRASVLAGRPLDDLTRARMKQEIAGALAQSRRDMPLSQREGFAEMIASSMQELSIALAQLTSLPPEVRRAIVDFDPTRPQAEQRAQAITSACSVAVERMIGDRFASFIAATRDPQSKTFQYYRRAHDDALAPENRQLVRGLDRLREVIEGAGS